MALARGIARPLLFIGLIVLISSADVAEAGLFDGLIQGMFNQVKGMMDQVVTETFKKFSVLSGIFGEGMTRGDLSLPEIITGAFSRNNGIFIGNSTAADMDWKLGDGSNVLAAISTGGSVAVSNSNGKVTITTGKQPQPEKKEEEQEEKEKPEEKKCPKGKEGKKCRKKKREQKAKEKAEREAAELAAKEEAEKNGTISSSGSDMDQAFVGLLSDWDDFVTSSIWDAQEHENQPEPSGEANADDVSLPTSERVINGIFFGNAVPSGASFAVKFFYNNEENFYCSGSLIGYPYALTAAHCGIVVGDNVRVGGRLLRSGYQATVAEVFTHPDFEAGSLVHDVAVVRLDNLGDKKTLMDNGVKAARLNKDKSFPEVGFVGVLSGHGSVKTDGKGVSDELRTTRHTTYEMSKCKEEITQGNLDDEESYLCAGDGERSTTCVGDSGAGLWRYRVKETAGGKKRKFYEIYGVVSFGEVTDEALCPRGPPTVFQRTSENYDWIVGMVGKDNMP